MPTLGLKRARAPQDTSAQPEGADPVSQPAAANHVSVDTAADTGDTADGHRDVSSTAAAASTDEDAPAVGRDQADEDDFPVEMPSVANRFSNFDDAKIDMIDGDDEDEEYAEMEVGGEATIAPEEEAAPDPEPDDVAAVVAALGGSGGLTNEDIDALGYKPLEVELKKRGLPIYGTKDQKAERLKQAVRGTTTTTARAAPRARKATTRSAVLERRTSGGGGAPPAAARAPMVGPWTKEEFASFGQKQLKDELAKRGKPVYGTKAVLRARLREAVRGAALTQAASIPCNTK